MNQVQRILKSNTKAQLIGGVLYVGENPKYAEITHPITKVVTFKKVSRGVPFVRSEYR